MEINIQKRVLEANETQAQKNRNFFKDQNVFVINMMSSPGSGKTQTLCRTLEKLMPAIRTGVIVGDICTTNDADRLAVTGVKVTQINTDQFGGDCHLSANLIFDAAKKLGCDDLDLLIVENIGNLVCPAEFDIGEDVRVVVLSVTEGEDKPLKYPLMFRVADAAILNKIDLLPYLDFDAPLAVDNMKKVHSRLPVFEISAKTQEGFEPWIEWIKLKVFEKTGR
ncbi:MAG: hydrogenase nickel incorporation protein HypB [Proteobacteria bacterium]|nr:hydrogenase nickel incorporation protein HypB [Pseudomonadota bacterium]MBU1389274.1 hydrogenase nickel incorporation protein HypB [Pseudomonadota bacterium]MBU1544094.1 hydrogenase nickel incorporation protein HypB [Pseudomonadota bacterium]MBU2430096.1 hydrogenase nickel incorporation protein HypB [Pseudomonadota bacterium]MBU2480629.1 hydrogenase nickel incorporation protein HypB [Pseudomonadota bacterium]